MIPHEKEADDQANQLTEEGFEVRGFSDYEVPVTSPEALVDWLNEHAFSLLEV